MIVWGQVQGLSGKSKTILKKVINSWGCKYNFEQIGGQICDYRLGQLLVTVFVEGEGSGCNKCIYQ